MCSKLPPVGWKLAESGSTLRRSFPFMLATAGDFGRDIVGLVEGVVDTAAAMTQGNFDSKLTIIRCDTPFFLS